MLILKVIKTLLYYKKKQKLGVVKLARRKYAKEHWKVEFVGKGEEDLIDILRRQFVRYVNEQHDYPVIGLKDDIIKEHFRESYRKARN